MTNAKLQAEANYTIEVGHRDLEGHVTKVSAKVSRTSDPNYHPPTPGPTPYRTITIDLTRDTMSIDDARELAGAILELADWAERTEVTIPDTDTE